jgi:hypothetical protein
MYGKDRKYASLGSSAIAVLGKVPQNTETHCLAKIRLLLIHSVNTKLLFILIGVLLAYVPSHYRAENWDDI